MTPTEAPAPIGTQPAANFVPPLRLYSPDCPCWSKDWLKEKAYIHWLSRGAPRDPPDDWADWLAVVHDLESELASAQGENSVWLKEHGTQLAAEQTHRKAQWIAVCCQTEPKVLAAATERERAFDSALESPLLIELAQQKGLPAEILLTMTYLDDHDPAQV